MKNYEFSLFETYINSSIIEKILYINEFQRNEFFPIEVRTIDQFNKFVSDSKKDGRYNESYQEYIEKGSNLTIYSLPKINVLDDLEAKKYIQTKDLNDKKRMIYSIIEKPLKNSQYSYQQNTSSEPLEEEPETINIEENDIFNEPPEEKQGIAFEDLDRSHEEIMKKFHSKGK